ncbi:hypothetical protein L1987_40088 [Smallanthus sonchifolius]|uniref:Uncharacterized protein n=1 Tax=Smallanthus sonchifolius TaxID=185202 RepID=A0ACB9GTM0_9ASTR|nr:hypothetical protein L1987_40088 [Smallanthus sonchifolius]
MMDFLKARGEIGKRLGHMSFMNLQALYVKVKKEEEERLEKTCSKRRTSSSLTKESKSSHPAPPHQQPPKKKTKPTTTPEDSREIVVWFYSNQDQWFEVFRGKAEVKRSIYKSVDEVMQLPDSDLQRMIWYTLIDVRCQKMRCSSKTIFSMPSKDIKTLSELPLDNPSMDPKGYETAKIVAHMQKLQQQRQ